METCTILTTPYHLRYNGDSSDCSALLTDNGRGAYRPSVSRENNQHPFGPMWHSTRLRPAATTIEGDATMRAYTRRKHRMTPVSPYPRIGCADCGTPLDKIDAIRRQSHRCPECESLYFRRTRGGNHPLWDAVFGPETPSTGQLT